MKLVRDVNAWCGCLPARPFGQRRASALRPAASPLFTWYAWARPSENQNGSSCVGHGWGNCHEAMLCRYLGVKVQLDGDAIHRRAREMFYNGDMDGGLTIPEGFQAMLDLGIYPKGTELVEVPNDWDSVGAALLVSPLVQGHHIHDGWFNCADNGCIDHSGSPKSSDGYHCTTRVARHVQDERRFYGSVNSWDDDWGWHGRFVMTIEEDAEGAMEDGPYYARLPDGWKEWNGWKKYAD